MGQRIEQGERIGAVGATGWATGPHLHFEFKVNGAHQDPMAMAKASEALTIAPAAKRPVRAARAGVPKRSSMWRRRWPSRVGMSNDSVSRLGLPT